MTKNRASIHRWIQVSLVAIGAIGLAQCVDGIAGPRSEYSTLGITPVWGPGAARALSVLDEGGFPLDRVRIVLTLPPSDTLKDTTVALTRKDPGINLPLTVRVVPGNAVHVVLQYKSGETLLYDGAADVETVPLDRPNPIPRDLPMVYEGPGKDATHITVAPGSGSFPTSANVAFVATAFDVANVALPGTPIYWSVDDETLGVFTAPGVFTPTNKGGVVTVTAETPTHIKGTTSVTLIPPSVATGLTLVSGNGQTAVVHTALGAPLVVKVADQFGNPMNGVTVTWTRLTGGGTLGAATSTTNASGVASVSYTLGNLPVDETVRASVSGIASTITFTAHAIVGPPAAIAIVSGNAQSDTVFKTLAKPFVVKVSDAVGNVLSGATVTWTRTGGFGTPATATSTTDAGGLASLSYRLGDVSGTETVSASVTGVATPVVFTATALDGGPQVVPVATGFAYLRVTPNPAAPRVGDTLTFTADSIDAAGNATRTTALWSSSNPGRGAIDASGRLIVADTGAIIITATRNGLVGHGRVGVLPAPMLSGFSFAPKTLNGITNSPLTASFTFAASDAGTGITAATLTLTAPDGVTTRACTFGAPTTGTARNGVFDCSLTLPLGSATGVWHVTNLVLNGSITCAFGASVLALFSPTTLTINP